MENIENQHRLKLPQNLFEIVATQPYDQEGKIELINAPWLEMVLGVWWVIQFSQWQVGKMDIICSIF